MKSRTSFFNLSVFKKDITRFAPLWVLYTVFLFLLNASMGGFAINYYSYSSWRMFNSSLAGYNFLNFIYAGITAQLLFGDLFKSRMCNALHALPMKRETWFGSHLLAGLSFSLVPNLAVTLLMLPSLGDARYGAFLWLGGMELEFLFFFGVGVLSMLLTGNRFAMVLVYGILNFGSLMAWALISAVYLPLMPGVELVEESFLQLCPLVQIVAEGSFFLVTRKGNVNGRPVYEFGGLGDSWIYLLICAGIGVVCLGLALVLYRRRALEKAGDFIAVEKLSPVFLVLYTLFAAVFMLLFGTVFSTQSYLPSLLFGMVIGFFTGKMLLERSIRVFRKKTFLGLGIFAAVLMLSVGIVKWDVLHIVRFVPEQNQVAYVAVNSRYYGDQQFYSQPQQVEIVRQFHKDALDTLLSEGENANSRAYELEYHLTNGMVVRRTYALNANHPSTQELRELLDNVLGGVGDWEEFKKSVTHIEINGKFGVSSLDEKYWPEFLDLLYAASKKGQVKGEVQGSVACSIYLYTDNGVCLVCIPAGKSTDFELGQWLRDMNLP